MAAFLSILRGAFWYYASRQAFFSNLTSVDGRISALSVVFIWSSADSLDFGFRDTVQSEGTHKVKSRM